MGQNRAKLTEHSRKRLRLHCQDHHISPGSNFTVGGTNLNEELTFQTIAALGYGIRRPYRLSRAHLS